MKRVRAFFRRLLGRFLKRRRRPLEPPRRLREEAELQVLRSRTWTPEDWARFASSLAENAYVDGYQRGIREQLEPQPTRSRSIDRYDWSFWDGHPSTIEVKERRGDPGDPLAGVPAEAAQEFLRAMLEHPGTYVVRVDEGVGRVVSIRHDPGSHEEEQANGDEEG